MNVTSHTRLRSKEMAATATARATIAANSLSVHHLRAGQESEVLGFLAERTLHTVVMAGHAITVWKVHSLCILVDDESRRARVFFERIGFKLHSYYDTVFLEQAGPEAINS